MDEGMFSSHYSHCVGWPGEVEGQARAVVGELLHNLGLG